MFLFYSLCMPLDCMFRLYVLQVIWKWYIELRIPGYSGHSTTYPMYSVVTYFLQLVTCIDNIMPSKHTHFFYFKSLKLIFCDTNHITFRDVIENQSTKYVNDIKLHYKSIYNMTLQGRSKLVLCGPWTMWMRMGKEWSGWVVTRLDIFLSTPTGPHFFNKKGGTSI